MIIVIDSLRYRTSRFCMCKDTSCGSLFFYLQHKLYHLTAYYYTIHNKSAEASLFYKNNLSDLSIHASKTLISNSLALSLPQPQSLNIFSNPFLSISTTSPRSLDTAQFFDCEAKLATDYQSQY